MLQNGKNRATLRASILRNSSRQTTHTHKRRRQRRERFTTSSPEVNEKVACAREGAPKTHGARSGGALSFLSLSLSENYGRGNRPAVCGRATQAATTSCAYERHPHGVRRRPPSVHAQLRCFPGFDASAAAPDAAGHGQAASLSCLSCYRVRYAATVDSALCSAGGGVQQRQQRWQR